MAEPSPEIEQVLRDTLDALGRSDIEGIGRRTSRDPFVVGIGSDPAEWAEGYDNLMRVWGESTPEAELGVKVGLDDVKGSARAVLAGRLVAGISRWPVSAFRFA